MKGSFKLRLSVCSSSRHWQFIKPIAWFCPFFQIGFSSQICGAAAIFCQNRHQVRRVLRRFFIKGCNETSACTRHQGIHINVMNIQAIKSALVGFATLWDTREPTLRVSAQTCRCCRGDVCLDELILWCLINVSSSCSLTIKVAYVVEIHRRKSFRSCWHS